MPIVNNPEMDKPKKKLLKLESTPNFEEIDHRLACGWYTEVEASGQRKRFLKTLQIEAAD